ncbi:translation elongation factor Ts [Leptospira sp. GIMC2001]|uniref:translation elongation factor Ts n=1 Tax=Leptospira sp. GIMC2001 TaxID=1513297 RepID=UPI00234B678E|nr:translation elongation factor Ts [Leptospira sp. GIMC2001]WCL48735.1 translation elongation factor Ts [Leptospira sp. GIMC2001]
MSSTDLIKELRERTGAGMLDCKKALTENNNDIDKAAEYLREKGMAKAAKRVGRETSQGRVISYIHGAGKVGVLVQLSCETDFVANNEDFEGLGRDICMQIAAMAPLFISEDQVNKDDMEAESRVIKAQLEQEGKKAEQIEKILPGKLKKYYSEVCLLNQAYIKDNTKTINDIIQESIAKFGENITVAKFSRFQVG